MEFRSDRDADVRSHTHTREVQLETVAADDAYAARPRCRLRIVYRCVMLC